jgi:peptide methionine sulfoxide reductase msrA/msrB
VRVRFDPARVSLEEVLIRFWENHDPTQGNRQGNDIGSNYRSAVYYSNERQRETAQRTRDIYQQALTAAKYPAITTEILPLKNYNRAEETHQDYLLKNPDGYCGLGGTGVAYPKTQEAATPLAPSAQWAQSAQALDARQLAFVRQLVVFEAEDCPWCKKFRAEILPDWQTAVPIATSLSSQPPRTGATVWQLEKALFATPTIVLFEQGREVSRYTGYNGDKERFWQWLGYQLLDPEARRIAFEQGTEPAFAGSHLDEKRPGVFVDPITGAPLFRSDTKYESGSGWPSFFTPVEGAITLHTDHSHGMTRTEVRSASSGIHLGHVFDDGPPPTGKRYCINGNVLKFVPNQASGDR